MPGVISQPSVPPPYNLPAGMPPIPIEQPPQHYLASQIPSVDVLQQQQPQQQQVMYIQTPTGYQVNINQ